MSDVKPLTAEEAKEHAEFLSRNIGDWSEADAGWCCDHILAQVAEIAKLRKQVETLREALSPLAQVIPPTWKRDVPLKAQSTDTFRYKLPLVRHYDEAVTALKATEPKVKP